LPFLKQTVGGQPDRGALHPGWTEIRDLSEELEWRHTPQALMDRWKFGYDRQIVVAADHDLSVPHRLSIEHRRIDSVYVTNSTEHTRLIADFPALAEKVFVWREADSLA
jgi:hypothetical protein